MSNCDNAIEQAAKSLGLDKEFVSSVYKGYWKTINEYISSLEFPKDCTEEEYNRLIRPNINIPSIGKLCVTYNRYKNVLKKFEYIKDIRKREKNGDNES